MVVRSRTPKTAGSWVVPAAVRPPLSNYDGSHHQRKNTQTARVRQFAKTGRGEKDGEDGAQRGNACQDQVHCSGEGERLADGILAEELHRQTGRCAGCQSGAADGQRAVASLTPAQTESDAESQQQEAIDGEERVH